jgi:transcriptional regulator with PAS, ATPase and Fis domain
VPIQISKIGELLPSAPPPAKSIEPRCFGGLMVSSAAMQQALTVLERLASTDLTVTLLGETGTGKDVLAHTLHREGARASAPFVVFDCGAVAANLAESELFGHERGAFTGAHSVYAGAFERADGGTLFLDEVGELPLDLQPRLLRALENRRVRRVGGNEYRAVSLRVVAATNRDLKSLVAAGRFRSDLYFRLATAVVSLPALRDRLEDIPLLVRRLLEDLGRPGVSVSDAAFRALRAHPWPGNVRELKNTLACTLAFVEDGRMVEAADLRLQSPSDESVVDSLLLSGHSLERIERAAIRQTLAYTRGNKVLAAQTLGIAVSTLYQKVKKYQL